MYKLNVPICLNEHILFFFLFVQSQCIIGFTNANIKLWGVGT